MGMRSVGIFAILYWRQPYLFTLLRTGVWDVCTVGGGSICPVLFVPLPEEEQAVE